MVTIVQDFIPPGRRNRPGYKLDPKYITIHDTANTQAGADARAHARYLKGSSAASLPVSWHYTVDDKVIYQHLPLENGWHAGDGASGTGNRQSIGIEICENRDGNRAAAEANAAWLVAQLLKDFGLDLDRVKQHNYWSGKNCPRVIRGRVNGWAGFLAAVQSHLDPAVQTPLTGKPEAAVTQAQEWACQNSAHQRFIDIAPVYWHYGQLTGLRPEMLYSQSAHETAFGRYGGAVTPDQNNWARIKVKNPEGDQAEDYETFATPEDGVRGHFNHICAYVGYEPIGRPHPRFEVVKSMPWAGTVRYVEELGGKWTPQLDYGRDLVRNYLSGLLSTAQTPEEPAPLLDNGSEQPPSEIFKLFWWLLRKLKELFN